MSTLEAQVVEARAQVLRVEAERGEKCAETENLRRDMDGLRQAQTVSRSTV